MMENFFKIILQLIATVGISGTVIVICAFYWIQNPGSLEKFVAWIYKILQNVCRFSYDKYDKKRIEKTFEAALKSTSHKMSDRFDFIPEFDCKIDWVDGEAESDLREGVIYIRMQRSNKESDTMINTVHLIIQAATFPELKKILSSEQQKALDLYITYLFSFNMDRFHRNSFDNVFTPIIKSNDAIEEYYKKYDNIYKHGYFDSVLIDEFTYLERHLVGRMETVDQKKLHQEIDEFILCLTDFANRQTGQDEKEINGVSGRYVSVFFMIFAKRKKLGNILPHLGYIEARLRDFSRCYVFSNALYGKELNELCCNLNHVCRVAAQHEIRAVLHNRSNDIDRQAHVTVLEKKQNIIPTE